VTWLHNRPAKWGQLFKKRRYADDTIVFLEHNLLKAVNMKLILCIFEELSKLKINFYKSELFYFGKVKDEEDQYK
jgi:hypothetical protein